MQIAPPNQSDKSPIAAFIERLIAAGCDPVVAGSVVAELALSRLSRDIENRRVYERDRKRRYRSLSPGQSRDNSKTLNKSDSYLGDMSPGHQKATSTLSKITKKEKSRTRISGDWNLAEDERSYALAKGLSEGETGAEAEKFKNHYMAKGDTMSDWKAAWRKWVGNALEYKGRAPVTSAVRGLTPAEYHAKYTRKANGKADCEATANERATEREDFQGQFLPSR